MEIIDMLCENWVYVMAFLLTWAFLSGRKGHKANKAKEAYEAEISAKFAQADADLTTAVARAEKTETALEQVKEQNASMLNKLMSK